MDNTLFLLIILSTCVFTKADEIKEGDLDSGSKDGDGDSFPHLTVGSSVGTLLFLVLLLWLIYYLCCRKKAPEGFTQFNNDNGGHSRRKHWRWRNKHFWRRNRRQNYGQNNLDVTQATNVIIQPVVLAIPTQDQNPSAPNREDVPPNMPPPPPAYHESMNNPPMPSQFMNPPMPNNFNNSSIPSNFNNYPTSGNFYNPPMPSNFNNPPMPSNFNNPPTNPNASPYYTKH